MSKRRNLATLAEAAAYSRLNEQTLRRYIARGDLPGYRVGPRAIRVDLNEIDSLLQPITTPDGAA